MSKPGELHFFTTSRLFMEIKMAWIALAMALISLSAAQGPGAVLKPPWITAPDSPQTFYVHGGEPFHLRCEAEGTPKPLYEWHRNGKIIEDGNADIKFDSSTGALDIYSSIDIFEGVFMCRAYSIIGGNRVVSVSQPQTLIAARFGQFKKPDRPIPDINTTEYSYVSLRCSHQGEVIDYPYNLRYKWLTNQFYQFVNTDDGRLYISNDGTLHFTYTLMEDELRGSNAYRCGINGMLYRHIRLGPPMILKVLASTRSQVVKKPVMEYNTNGLQATLGTTAELECFFSGYDPTTPDKLPIIQWFDSSMKPIEELKGFGTKYSLSLYNRTLRITDVQEDDEKYYGCQGINSAGSTSIQNVYLNVTSPPIWVRAPMSNTVLEGRNVSIYCIARSSRGEKPPYLPIWHINGQNFESVVKSNVALSDDKQVLTVRNVTKPKDILCVQCIVINDLGSTYGDACINVILPIQLDLVCDKCENKNADECSCNRWEISKGDTIRFRLVITTDPGYTDSLNQTWTFKNETYTLPRLPPFWNYDPISQVYYVNTEDLTEENYNKLGGKYHFNVNYFDLSDIKKETITIQLKDVVPVPIQLDLVCDKCENKNTDECSCNQWEISKGDTIQFRLIITTDPGYADRLNQIWAFKNEIYTLPRLPPFWNYDPISHVYRVNTKDMHDKDFYSLEGKYQFKVCNAHDNKEETITIQIKDASEGNPCLPGLIRPSLKNKRKRVQSQDEEGELWVKYLKIKIQLAEEEIKYYKNKNDQFE